MGGKNQTTTQQQTNTPAGLSQLQDIWGRVQQVASQPYTPYNGQMVSDLSGTQQSGIQNINSAQGSAQPYFNQAADYARTGASQIDPADVQRYMSPYTQQVVDATRANFQQDNAIGQNQVVGNAAMKGALGGDRVGVAQAELRRQQKLAQDPVIAGMYSGAYDKAMGAAQQDRAAAAQGAYTFGALAPSVQNAQISGGQAQLGAGALEQGTDQAKLTAAYNHYLQQQAFPYQQAGFLASAGLPAVGAMGGSSSGSSTTPGPNPWVQAAGLGLSAASMFSDGKIKKNKRQIGETFDGQPIFSFTYGDSPQTHIGLIAQEVEKKHPEAVGEVGGVKTVDYAMATDDAADKRGFADGGLVNFMEVQGYVPKFAGVQAASPYSSAPTLQMSGPQRQGDPMAGFTPDKMRAAGTGMRNIWSSLNPAEGGNYLSGMSGAIPSSVTGMVGGGVKRGGRINGKRDRFGETVDMIRQTLRRGGAVRGYAEGGGVGFGGRFNASFDLSPSEYVSRGFDDTQDAMATGAFDPQGANAMGPAAFAPPQPPAIPFPMARPAGAPGAPMANPMASLPPEITGPAMPHDAMAYDGAGASPYARPPVQPPAAMAPSQQAPSAAPERGMGGWNPLGLSDDARMGLVSAGLGIAASKSPFALSAIGEGGQQGVKVYAEQKSERRKAETEAKRLMQQVEQFTKTHGLNEGRLAETTRHNKQAEAKAEAQLERGKFQYLGPNPDGTKSVFMNQVTGETEERPVQIGAKPKAAAAAGLLDDDTIQDMAGQYLSGDKSVMQNLGRGAQGAENIVKLRGEITKQARALGLKPDQVATKMADFAGRTAAMRTLGTRGANVEYAANTANKAIDLAQEAYAKLPRGQFVPFNQLRELYDKKTSSPEQAAAYAATNTLVNEYARVASGGSNQATEGMRHHAREMLNTAMGPEAFNAVLNMMRREIQTAKAAYNETRKEFLEDQHGKREDTGTPSPAATPKVGDRKQFKQGWGVWDGKEYKPEAKP